MSGVDLRGHHQWYIVRGFINGERIVDAIEVPDHKKPRDIFHELYPGAEFDLAYMVNLPEVIIAATRSDARARADHTPLGIAQALGLDGQIDFSGLGLD